MTFLGKIVIVVQVVLSLMFMAFAGAVFSVQTNWKTRAEGLQTRLEEDGKSLNQQITECLLARGLLHGPDGRIHGQCPFPSHPDVDASFYFSPISGRFWCFGAGHPGRQPAATCISDNAYKLAEAVGIPTPVVRCTKSGLVSVEIAL